MYGCCGLHRSFQDPLSCDPAAREVPSTFMRWMEPEERPKSLHMKATMFALLPLKGQTRNERRDASVEELSPNSEQRVLPGLLNMN